MILAGDVGGTKTVLGLFRLEADGPQLACKERLPSDEHAGLAPMVKRFLATEDVSVDDVEAACFGVAGPVTGNRATPPNLPWEVDGERLAAELDLVGAVVLNDVVAMAEAIPLLGELELETLQAGESVADGHRLLVAAGTGFGATLIPRLGDEHLPMAGEAGHADFAPRDELDWELAGFLARRHGRVSVERVVSGPGSQAIWEFLGERGGWEEPAAVSRRIEGSADPPREITEAGLSGRSARCRKALEMFVAAYGATAGNLALVGLATGGVYIGGGIAPKLLEMLRDGPFLDAFRDKGRFRDLVSAIPVRVILEPDTPLLGAARWAVRRLDEA